MDRGAWGFVPPLRSIRSAVCQSIIWKHGRAWVSVADRYHPFRWRNASWTFPPASSWEIISPTCFVRASRSARSDFCTSRCIALASWRRSCPDRRSDVRRLISCHVSSLTQSLRFRRVIAGSTHAACIVSNVVVSSSYGPPGGSRTSQEAKLDLQN